MMQEQLTPDERADLTWYFTRAGGDCGIRSPLGSQLEMLQAGIVPGKNSRRMLPDVPESVYNAGHRANAVAKRLRALTRRQQSTLEGQYSNEENIGEAGVTLSVASNTSLARQSLQQANVDLSKLRSKRAVEAAKASKREQAATTIRNWLIYLSHRAVEDEVSLEARALGQILAQARTSLADAVKAYVGTR